MPSHLYGLKGFKHLSLFFLSLHVLCPKALKQEWSNPTIPFLPTYLEGSIKSACFLQNTNFSFGKGLIIISNTLLLIWIFSKKKWLHLFNISSPLVSNLNVFWLKMKKRILTKMDCTLTVTMQHKFLLHYAKIK